MTVDIFRLNWILIDTVIIILLLFFLITVRIFKMKLRWRSNFSHSNAKHVKLKISDFSENLVPLKIKEISLEYNEINEPQKRSILFNTYNNKRKRWMRALCEGLVSRGYLIVNIILKTRDSANNKENGKKIPNYFEIIKDRILYHFTDRDFEIKREVFLSFETEILPYLLFPTSDLLNKMIFINPTVYMGEFTYLKELYNLKKSTLFFIFSEKRNKLQFNNNLERFKKSITEKNGFTLRVISKSCSNFKFYETLLLAHLIRMIDTPS